MKTLKPHFKFSKKERSGIFLLLLLIGGFQCIYFFVDFPSEEIVLDENELKRFQAEMDSLRLVEIENNAPKIYPFNPNYITDYRGYSLGMTNEEIDRLVAFRKENRWINSAKEFQQVTQVSDSLLGIISPYFQFPEWVENPKSNSYATFIKNNGPKSLAQKLDLNTATAQQLQSVNGIGVALSERIVKYREKFNGGFIADVQLSDIYGLTPEVIERITNDFTVKTPRAIQKLDINTATADQLVTIQYIDYEIAYNIIGERTLRDGFKSLDELLKVKNFPINKIEIIKLYLTPE